MIPRNLLPDLFHLRPQGSGFQHFHGFAHGEQLLHEIKCRAQVIVEHGVLISAFFFFLGMVKRQRTQIVCLKVVHFEFDDLRLLVAEDDAEAGGEVGTRVEILWYREILKLDVDVQETVECIDLQRGVAVFAQQVPAAFEDLQRVGLHVVVAGKVVGLEPERSVVEGDHLAVAHCLQDGGEKFAAERVVFQQDTVAQLGTLVNVVVHRQRLEHPPPETRRVGNIIPIHDVVTVGMFVAPDFDAEDVPNVLFVVHEGASGVFLFPPTSANSVPTSPKFREA